MILQRGRKDFKWYDINAEIASAKIVFYKSHIFILDVNKESQIKKRNNLKQFSMKS